jgi:hypothetical protein
VSYPRTRLAVVTGILSGVLVVVTLLQCMRLIGYHATPSPEGMLARFELPPSMNPFALSRVVAHGGDTVTIEVRQAGGRQYFFSFPAGKTAPRTVHPIDPGPFDFDGDGAEDEIEHSMTSRGWAHARVLSGATEEVLFRNSDPMACTPLVRAHGLPDLDGDGCSELAVYHPRDDRNYDVRPMVDGIIDVKSWLTIVSYDGP